MTRRQNQIAETWLYMSLTEIGNEFDMSPAEVRNMLRHRHPALTRGRRIRAVGSTRLSISRSALEALKETYGHGRRTLSDPVTGDWLTPYERKTS